MENNVNEKKVKKEKTEEEKMLERLADSRDDLRVIHEMRWNLSTIFSDIGDTSDYITANEVLSEKERRVWDYIMNGSPE